MRLISLLVLVAGSLLAPEQAQVAAASISFKIGTSALLPSPATLSSNTKATLFRHNGTLVAPLTRRNGFDFKAVAPGSYLFTVQCRDFTFPPLRVDVLTPATAADVDLPPGTERVEAWQTFWGNEWANKGERRGVGDREVQSTLPVLIEIRPDRPKDYYIVKEGFSPYQFIKNPMILMSVFSLGLIIGMPMLMDSMDEETRAEFEELQKQSPVSQATNQALNFQNFDLASWMAGKQSGAGTGSGASDDAASASGTATGATSSSGSDGAAKRK